MRPGTRHGACREPYRRDCLSCSRATSRNQTAFGPTHRRSDAVRMKAATKKKLLRAVETYLEELRRLRASGGATPERSSYPALKELFGVVGATLKPKVFPVVEPANQGAGHPDIGLYAAHQVRKQQPAEGQTPERGVVEVKSPATALLSSEVREQASTYWRRYQLVLLTNLWQFKLVGRGGAGDETVLECFSLANSHAAFERRLDQPRAFAGEVGTSLCEYLVRTLEHQAAITEPKILARLLASYARDGLARIEASGGSDALDPVRTALEEALGVRFEGGKGVRFFHSTLIQTLFYGIFSAWVLAARRDPGAGERFEWRKEVWTLRAEVLGALFFAVSGKLEALGLAEILDWTEAALRRVDRDAFLSRFDEGEAVQYFYEPFLEAFDPVLRKELGVWYTPSEVVRYMVARVDLALKEELEVPEGLAAENVYVLDPCCGTGAYVAEVLRRIHANLRDQGFGALSAARVKQAATDRVFGFEIMPAPFVVAHLQIGLALEVIGAPLADDADERAAVFLTNALTGWEPRTTKPLPFPELEEERDRADRVKQQKPILVILGNPPYDGYAGMAVDEERELSNAYRSAKRAPAPQGQGLNDPYVRFFRMAERRIAERTGQGVVCFISNFSWLKRLSFTGMRERFLEAFDTVRIDCLNGDSRETGKVTPDGLPDPSIFSTENDPVGIRVGTAIATLVRKRDHDAADSIGFRHLWGQAKQAELTRTAESAPAELYERVEPVLKLGLPFSNAPVADDWFDWPELPELLPVSFPGVTTSRDGFLVDVEEAPLRSRVVEYFDSELSHEELRRRLQRRQENRQGCRHSVVMKATRRFDAVAAREKLLARGGPDDSGFVRYAYRPFDTRWLYWERDTKLLDERRSDYWPHVFDGNLWLSAAKQLRRGAEQPQACFSVRLSSYHLIERGANMFPARLRVEGLGAASDSGTRPNLSPAARRYLDSLGLGVDDLFHHILAVLHDPAYREENSGGLEMGWPRIPLPGWPEGEGADARVQLLRTAERGRALAALVDPERPVPGVTQAPIPPEVAAIAVPATCDDGEMGGDDFNVTAGWGYLSGDAVMPGEGRVEERPLRSAERGGSQRLQGVTADGSPAGTYDIYLNDRTFWRNVPAEVWHYELGGYRVLKKWLSYRDHRVLGRPMRPEEVLHFTATARRIATILRLTRGSHGEEAS